MHDATISHRLSDHVGEHRHHRVRVVWSDVHARAHRFADEQEEDELDSAVAATTIIGKDDDWQ